MSDSCSSNQNEDKSGPRLHQEVLNVFPGSVIERRLISDDKTQIKETLLDMCASGIDVILTTGWYDYHFNWHQCPSTDYHFKVEQVFHQEM